MQFEAIDPRILPEMSAKVSFLSQEVGAQEQQALLAVNPEALVERDGRTVLLVVRDGARVAEVPVVPGSRIGDLVAVTGDVRSGDKVVLKPPADLKTGTLTRPATR